MKRTYKINTIPSFSYEMDVPTGLSSLFNYKGKADIYVHGKWATWDNIFYKEEPEILDSIDKFFRFLNHPRHYSESDLKRLDALNKSSLGRKMFEHLSGWTFKFYDCAPNSDTFIIRRQEPTYRCSFELTPNYSYNPTTQSKYIISYNYSFFCNSGCGPANENKTITGREGLDLIELMRLSFLAMINKYPEERSSEIRVFNGHYNYKENLIDYCKSNKLLM